MKTIIKSVAIVFAVVSIGFITQSCSTVKPINNEDLAGYWALQSINGEQAGSVFKGSVPSLVFDSEKLGVSGNAGCNNYIGQYTLTPKNEFSAPRLASTMKLCMDANQEPQFLKAMGETSILSIENGLLTFKNKGKVTLQFAKGETPKAPEGAKDVNAENLSGEWTLKTISGQSATDLFTGKIPSMNFDPAGSVSGNSGCNNYRSSYKLDSNTVTLGPVMGTKMACPNLENEAKFTKLLEAPLQASIHGDQLMFIQNGNVALVFTKVVK